jgi:putative DNA methylase
VAVLINKAMIEIPPKFAGRKPVGPMLPGDKQGKMHEDWSGARGLAEDVRRYGHWMREQAEQRIGHLYPKVPVTAEMAVDRPDLKPYVGEELTVIAWLWARTVKSPNPAFAHVDVPLASSFVLSSKKGKEAWVQPVVDGDAYHFEIRVGTPPSEAKGGTTAGKRAAFICLMSDVPMDYNHIRSEGKAGRMGQKLMAIVAEGKRGRVYLAPTEEQEAIAAQAQPTWKPDTPLPDNTRDFKTPNYGMKTYGDLFTPRQLVALTTFSDLVGEARDKVIADAKAAGLPDDGQGLDAGGTSATAYGDAVATYLTFGVNRLADRSSTICGWDSGYNKIRNTFGRQAIPMTWDYCEGNAFSESTGNFVSLLEWVFKFLNEAPANSNALAAQADAARQSITESKVVSTDPPYYDNIGYADLSDYFYVWARRSLRKIYLSLFGTMAVPKTEELVATPYRHGGKVEAEKFFLDGMGAAMHQLAVQANPSFPVTIYYAFKQSETKDTGSASTGWETFLEAVISSGFGINGTWPMRTEMGNRMIGSGTNALASSIVLVCRKRESTAETISRRDFQRQLREQMPEALETMIGGTTGQSPIAPVDLAQAAIGPGMAIYSKYAGVLNQDGTPMSVHDALILINREITDYLTPDAGSFDNDTLFCNSWFEGFGWSFGPFGDANTLAQAKGTSVGGVQDAGVVESGAGKVRLLRWAEYPGDWDPQSDTRTPIWEAAHHLIRALNQQGESEAGALLARMPDKGEAIRQLAYHLYTLCERKKWADDARAYNELITAWHAIVTASHETGHRGAQMGMDL